jgi:hypothetical protein
MPETGWPACSTRPGSIELSGDGAEPRTGLDWTSVQSITDVASAQAALPRLREVTTQIDRVSDLRGQLTVEQRRALAGLVNPLMSALNQLFDRVLALPGVGEVLKPTIDALRAKLAALAA